MTKVYRVLQPDHESILASSFGVAVAYILEKERECIENQTNYDFVKISKLPEGTWRVYFCKKGNNMIVEPLATYFIVTKNVVTKGDLNER